MERIENARTMEAMIKALAAEAEANYVEDQDELGVGD